MPLLSHERTDNGLRFEISDAELEKLGFREGEELQVVAQAGSISITPAPSAQRRVSRAALSYLLNFVGDATAIDDPRKNAEGEWVVNVYLSYEDKQIGTLVFSDAGKLLKEKSSSPEAMAAAGLVA